MTFCGRSTTAHFVIAEGAAERITSRSVNPAVLYFFVVYRGKAFTVRREWHR